MSMNISNLGLQHTSAIVKTGTRDNTVKRIGMIAGRTRATMVGHVLIRWQTSIAPVNLDFEVWCKLI